MATLVSKLPVRDLTELSIDLFVQRGYTKVEPLRNETFDLLAARAEPEPRFVLCRVLGNNQADLLAAVIALLSSAKVRQCLTTQDGVAGEVHSWCKKESGQAHCRCYRLSAKDFPEPDETTTQCRG
jgi:hypothetical protein